MDNIELQERIRRLTLDGGAKGRLLVVQYGDDESDPLQADTVQPFNSYLSATRRDGVTLEIPYAIITGVTIEPRE